MILKRIVGFVLLVLVLGPFPLYAVQPGQYDSAAVNVIFNKPTCFFGVIRSGRYVPRGHKIATEFFYLHLNNPVNINQGYFHPNIGVNLSTDHQYDFQIFINSTTIISHMMQFVGKSVRIMGLIVPSNLPAYYSPLPLDMNILKINIFRSSAGYKNVCKTK